MKAENYRVRYVLKIETTFESSGGYMRNSTIDEFLAWAQDQSRNLVVLIKEGGQEPKPVRADITVVQLALVRDEKS